TTRFRSWLEVAGAERRDRAVWRCRAPEQLVSPCDERPLLLDATAATGALCDMRFDAVRLDRRELAVEIGVQCAVIHVRHVHPPFTPRTLPPDGGAPERGSCRWRRAPGPSETRSRRQTATSTNSTHPRASRDTR